MREIRPSGSEGGVEQINAPSLPLSRRPFHGLEAHATLRPVHGLEAHATLRPVHGLEAPCHAASGPWAGSPCYAAAVPWAGSPCHAAAVPWAGSPCHAAAVPWAGSPCYRGSPCHLATARRVPGRRSSGAFQCLPRCLASSAFPPSRYNGGHPSNKRHYRLWPWRPKNQ